MGYSQFPKDQPYGRRMRQQFRNLRVTFPNRHGHSLVGRTLVVPTGDSALWALLAHCFTCGKDLKGYYYLCRSLADRGWGSMRFDFSGLGESGGQFADTDLNRNATDLEDAAAHLSAVQTPPRLLIGHSMGGAAVLLAAPQLASLRGLVLLGTPSDLGHLPAEVPEIRAATERGRPVETTIGGKQVLVGPQLLPSLVRQDLHTALRGLHLPVLILHAPGDEVVPFVHAERLAGWAGPRGTLIPLDGADHLLSSPEQAERAAHEIAEWALAFRGHD